MYGSEGMTEIIWSDVIIVHKGEFIRNIFIINF